MGLKDIEQRAKAGGYEALSLMERSIAFRHGFIQGWCSACGREVKYGQKRHFRTIGVVRRQQCLGRTVFQKPEVE